MFILGARSLQLNYSLRLSLSSRHQHHHAFPDDPIVGEANASDLQTDFGAALRERIVYLANETLTGELELGDNNGRGIGPGQQRSASYLLDAIDRENHPGGRTGLMWTIDPIDGTKGFIRGAQYAVYLAPIVDAQKSGDASL
ncbi:hypothetical protein JOM56_012345 [Amanita muscaria]